VTASGGESTAPDAGGPGKVDAQQSSGRGGPPSPRAPGRQLCPRNRASHPDRRQALLVDWTGWSRSSASAGSGWRCWGCARTSPTCLTARSPPGSTSRGPAGATGTSRRTGYASSAGGAGGTGVAARDRSPRLCGVRLLEAPDPPPWPRGREPSRAHWPPPGSAQAERTRSGRASSLPWRDRGAPPPSLRRPQRRCESVPTNALVTCCALPVRSSTQANAAANLSNPQAVRASFRFLESDVLPSWVSSVPCPSH